MKLDDTSSGIARDEREGTSLRTSATTGVGRNLEQAVTAALTSLIRQADLRFADLDAASVSTTSKIMRDHSGNAVATLVIATGIAYSKPYGHAGDELITFDE